MLPQTAEASLAEIVMGVRMIGRAHEVPVGAVDAPTIAGHEISDFILVDEPLKSFASVPAHLVTPTALAAGKKRAPARGSRDEPLDKSSQSAAVIISCKCMVKLTQCEASSAGSSGAAGIDNSPGCRDPSSGPLGDERHASLRCRHHCRHAAQHDAYRAPLAKVAAARSQARTFDRSLIADVGVSRHNWDDRRHRLCSTIICRRSRQIRVGRCSRMRWGLRLGLAA